MKIKIYAETEGEFDRAYEIKYVIRSRFYDKMDIEIIRATEEAIYVAVEHDAVSRSPFLSEEEKEEVGFLDEVS